MTNPNPHNPAIAGLEWYPTRRLPRALKVGTGIGAVVTSTAAESIASVWARLQAQVHDTMVGVDIYDTNSIFGANDVIGGVSIPNTDVAATAGWEQSSDNGVTFVPYQNGGSNGFPFVNKVIPDTFAPIDILSLITLDGTLLRYRPTGTQTEGHLTWQMENAFHKVTDATSGNDPSSNRVGWIEVNIAAKAANGNSPTLDGFLRVGDVNYGSDDGPRRISPHWARYTFRFYFNPATGTQWYNSDIAKFLSGGLNSFGLSIKGPAGTDYRIGAVDIVWRSLPELRLATGYAVASSEDGFREFALRSPTDGTVASWAKANANDYLLMFFLTGAGGHASINGVDQAALADNPGGALTGWLGADQPTRPNTPVPVAGLALSSWAPSAYMVQDSTAIGADAQPYVRPVGLTVNSTDGQDSIEIAGHSTDIYGQVVVALGSFGPGSAVPDADLVVQIRRTSDNVQIGGDANITSDQSPIDGRYHLVSVHLASSASLVSGTAYYLSFSTTSTVPWIVGGITTDDAFAEAAVVTSATWNGAADLTLNVLANISTVPAALTGFTVTPTVWPSVAPGGPTEIVYAACAWDASALGGDFGYYELQNDSSGGVWATIARLTNEAANSFADMEGLRNLDYDYRVRVVRADGASSDWTDIVTVTLPAGDCDLIFACNVDAFSVLGYQEVGDTMPHTYARANASSSVVHLIAGRQMPVAFRPAIEGNSDVFQRTILVAMDIAGSPVGPFDIDRRSFGAIIALIERSDFPYLAVCDGHGQRWFAFVEYVDGSYTWQGHEAQATLKFTEVSAVPVPVVAAS